MSDPFVEIDIKGMKEIQAKADQMIRDFSGDPVERGMREATLLITRTGRKNAPIDRGQGRASILPEIRKRDRVIEGAVGSNVKHMAWQEFGTRPIPNLPRGPIWRWAMRKTRGNKAAARSLFVRAWGSIRRRGVKAKRYLQGAMEEELPRVTALLYQTVRRIVNRKD